MADFDVVRRDSQIAPVKQRVNVLTEEQAVGWIMASLFTVWSNVRHFKDMKDVRIRDRTLSLTAASKQLVAWLLGESAWGRARLLMEVGSRKLMHVNVTAGPTSLWTIQQLLEANPSDHAYRWLIHDRSGIFSEDVDDRRISDEREVTQ